MKKIIVCVIALILGVCATQAFGQVSVYVQGRSILVQPPAYNVRVDVPRYYRVQPQPYVVTPIVVPPLPKPNFKTPIRDLFWRTTHKPRVYYYVQPYQSRYQQMPHRPTPR